MRMRFGLGTAVAICLALSGAVATGAVYYVNDDSSVGDVYTTATGNDLNSGTAPNAPKRTLASVLTNAMSPGDIVYIDTGTYDPVTIPAAVVGVAGNRIVFQGSTNFAAGGTVFTSVSGEILVVNGRHLHLRDIRAVGGVVGIKLNASTTHCVFENMWGISNGSHAVWINAGSSNQFTRSVFSSLSSTAFTASGRDNSVEHCVAISGGGAGFNFSGTAASNLANSISVGRFGALAGEYTRATRNVFSMRDEFHTTYETLAEMQRINSNWFGNTVADPRFVNAAGFDFHLLSVNGYATNGNPAVTNISALHSPAIDFGWIGDAAWTNEPAPNGERVNVGLHGGTAEASKSRTNAWLFAMSFNDGGNLMQTGRLEWVGGNLGPAAEVNLQYSTNNGGAWLNIATGVAASAEQFVWVPAESSPATLWRVVSSTNSAVASTNAKPFSIRTATNTAFQFYVNDNSLANDVYCTAIGNNANLGISPAAPKRTLQGILEAYSLRGGDVVYVDTGTYATTNAATIGRFDSGVAGRPVRILGSPRGTTLSTGNSSVDVMVLDSASHLEIENLRLASGRYGLWGNGSANVTVRGVQFRGNQHGVYLTSGGHVFENCLAATNSLRGIWATGTGMNRWNSGTIWGNPIALHAASGSLSVSNSILGGGTTLFASQVVSGDHNLVWDINVGLTYATFSDFQNAGLGLGDRKSVV